MDKIPQDIKNGSQVWEWLFKINQLLLPFVIAWAVWATASIFEMRNMEFQVKEWVRQNYPPEDLLMKIEKIHLADLEIRKELAQIRVAIAEMAHEH